MPGYTDHIFQIIPVAKFVDRAISVAQEAKEEIGFCGVLEKVEE